MPWSKGITAQPIKLKTKVMTGAIKKTKNGFRKLPKSAIPILSIQRTVRIFNRVEKKYISEVLDRWDDYVKITRRIR